jgi:hypothetical protein
VFRAASSGRNAGCELGRRNRELEMEVTFLRKAAAYFAKEHR